MKNTFRTRFAPSPTGPPHLGTLHTALFAFLAARSADGSFILRIDDTDKERSSEKFECEILSALKYMGIFWDEGFDVGGDYGPYRQSERMLKYQDAVSFLKEKDFLYPCFCSEAELAAKRIAARASGKPYKYDGACWNIDRSTALSRISQGEKPVWRFRVDPARLGNMVVFKDLVWGQQSFRTDLIGDFVCIKPDGVLTYMLASPLDDVAMKISHVIRGADHLPNTPMQILIMRAINANPPEFAHLPLITAIGGKKLSKRDSLTGLDEIRRFLPAALINHLTLLGWTHPDGKEILGIDELIESFSFDRISPSPASHDVSRLAWLEREHLRKLPSDIIVNHFLNSTYGDSMQVDERNRILLSNIVNTVRDEITTFAVLREQLLPILDSPSPELLRSGFESMDKSKARIALKTLLENEQKDWMELLESLALKQGKKDTYMPVRIALTGSNKGFELKKLINCLSKEEIQTRITFALSILQS